MGVYEKVRHQASECIAPLRMLADIDDPDPNAVRDALRRAADVLADLLVTPIPLILTCPACGTRHIDEGEWATKPHHTHACQACGLVWRPTKANTVGVLHLPGYKNETHSYTITAPITK